LIVNQLKAAVTRWCRKNDHPDFQWQSNYYDHIIRNGFQLDRIADYIRRNPSAWGN
jgi:REP element-mobilizing transposase RayT